MLESPWPDVKEICVWQVDKDSSPAKTPAQSIPVDANGCINLETQTGLSYLIGLTANLVEQWDEVQLTPEKNRQPKELGPVQLGKIRMF